MTDELLSTVCGLGAVALILGAVWLDGLEAQPVVGADFDERLHALDDGLSRFAVLTAAALVPAFEAYAAAVARVGDALVVLRRPGETELEWWHRMARVERVQRSGR